MADTELARRCAEGDPAAWRELVRRHTNLVYRLSLRMVRNPQEAEEICQEVFVRVHRSFGTYDPARALTPWIARTAYHACLRRLQSVARRSEQTSPPEVFETKQDDHAQTPEQRVGELEAQALLLRALDELPAQDRALLELRYRENLSDTEVSEATGIPVNTVKTRIFRARSRLRAWLMPRLGEEA